MRRRSASSMTNGVALNVGETRSRRCMTVEASKTSPLCGSAPRAIAPAQHSGTSLSRWREKEWTVMTT